jgi:nitrogen regulatory protein PII
MNKEVCLMFMIMFVLDNPDFLDQILKAWAEHGITGATIVESTGAYRRSTRHIPMRYMYGDMSSVESGNITFFVIVEDQQKVQSCLEAIEKIVGNLDDPNTGVFAAGPLAVTRGIPSRI